MNIADLYHKWVKSGRWYADVDKKTTGELDYLTHGLCGESGEFADQLKKMRRERGDQAMPDMTIAEHKKLLHELGDVLWYVTATCEYFQITLEDLIVFNTLKLHERGLRKPEGWNQDNPPEWPFEHITFKQAQAKLEIITGRTVPTPLPPIMGDLNDE